MEKSTNKIKNIMKEIKSVYEDLLVIHSSLQKENISSYQLLDLFNRLSLCVAKKDYKNDFLFEEMDNFQNQLNGFLQIWDLTNIYNLNPILFVDNGQTYGLSQSEFGTIALQNFLYERKNDFVETITNEEMRLIVEDFNNKAIECAKALTAKLDEIESDEYANFEDDDFEYKLANVAILRAIKNQNINECTLIPSDVRTKVIEIFQNGLHNCETRDIGNLYAMACKELAKTTQITKIIQSEHKSKTLKREKK